ncbi:MAG: glycosyl transferase [Bacteroidales bacterium]|nr:glycosyl transferase [Bacteroidales bacterium]MDD4670533.1 glycosyl transferase [Bacteroidales bacterium]
MEKKQQILRFAFYIILLLPLMLFRDITPMNELKYLSIANESLANGHFFTMFNHGVAYADKPPLYIWIIMFFKWFLGYHSTFILALFSLIPALVTIYIFNKWCASQMGKKYIIASELALLTSVYFIGSALVLRMDMLMTMFITLAMFTFYRMYMGDERMCLKIAFPIYVFMAIFSKGPVGIMVPLFCIPIYLLINRKIKTVFRYWGWRTWLILALLCGAWFACVYIEGGREYLNNLLFHQTIDRAVDSFHHKEPFYYYGYTIWYALAPWSILTIGIIIYGLCKKVKLNELTKFMLCTAGVIIVMMSIVSAKLVIYILPSFAFITYSAFMILEQLDNKKFAEGTRKVVIYGALSLLSILFVAGFFVSKYNYRIGYKEVSVEAEAAARKYGIDRYYYYNIRTGASLDAFLERPVEQLTQEQFNNPQSVIGNSNGIIIFAKEDGIVRFKAVLKE